MNWLNFIPKLPELQYVALSIASISIASTLGYSFAYRTFRLEAGKLGKHNTRVSTAICKSFATVADNMNLDS